MRWERPPGMAKAAEVVMLMALLVGSIGTPPHVVSAIASAAPADGDDPELDCMANPDDSRCTPATPRNDDWRPAPPLHCPGSIPGWPPWCRTGQQ